MKTLRLVAVLSFCVSFLLVSQEIIAQAKTPTVPIGSYRNIYDMLKDVAGLEVQSNGGKSGSVTVRGLGSLTRQGQPLFVINGAVYNGDIGGLNPQDVEMISVLKDISTTSAYGAQGAFGVISITLKKGATGFNAAVANHTESAYTYFIDHKTPLKVFDSTENVIIEGVIQKQRGDTLVFIKKRKDFLVPIASIKRVEMMPQQ